MIQNAGNNFYQALETRALLLLPRRNGDARELASDVVEGDAPSGAVFPRPDVGVFFPAAFLPVADALAFPADAFTAFAVVTLAFPADAFTAFAVVTLALPPDAFTAFAVVTLALPPETLALTGGLAFLAGDFFVDDTASEEADFFFERPEAGA